MHHKFLVVLTNSSIFRNIAVRRQLLSQA